MVEADAAILASVARYYSDRIEAFGPTAQGVDWRDARSHALRQAQLLRLVAEDPDASVFDLGCGYGDFLSVVRAAGHRGRYVGCDVSPEMLDWARRLHGDGPDRTWVSRPPSSEPCDYAIASGLFNVRRGTDPQSWSAFVDRTIEALATYGRKGFAFNMLTTSSDPDKRRADLHYGDPVATLRTCLDRFGRHVAVLQDYGLWEFTVIVRRS